MAGFFSRIFGGKKRPEPIEALGNVYRMRMDTAEVVRHNTLMNGITSTRGEAMGFIQENGLELREDGSFELTKELKSTKTNLLMKTPVSVRYVFTGRYQRDNGGVRLSPAEAGHGKVSWGTFSKFLDTGDGEYDSQTSPGILSLYPTAFFVENCKNTGMVIHLNEEERTFSIDPFELVILSAEEAGSVQRQEQALDPEVGLMKRLPVADPNPYCLKEYFESKGLLIGTCVNPRTIQPPYEEILLAQFSSVTLENQLKPEAILSQEKSIKTSRLCVQFSEETIRLLNWCREHRMPLRGHTLIWYMGTPEWIFHEAFAEDAPNVSRAVMLQRMEDLISGFFAALREGGWDEIMYCVDVVNEAMVAPNQLRKCPWMEIIGEDYVRYAYALARKYAPSHMKLAYNDFDLEAKTDCVIALIHALKDEKGSRLVDVVGQQGHYGAYSRIEALGPALEKIWAETGCEIQITELDVSVSRQGTEEELKTQGRFYYDFMQQVLALKARGVKLTSVTLWGFADALSWMPSGYLHIYDRNLVPKYAYYGLLGLREYAGFDGSGAIEKAGRHVAICLTRADGAEGMVRLRQDGSYTDTVTGAEIIGQYRTDDGVHFMLTPSVGGYCSLTLHPDGKAERVEAAGGSTVLIRQ